MNTDTGGMERRIGSQMGADERGCGDGEASPSNRSRRPGWRGRHRYLPALLAVLALVLIQAAWVLAPGLRRIERVGTRVGPVPSTPDQRYLVLSERLVLLLPIGRSPRGAMPSLLDAATGRLEQMPQLRKWIDARGSLSRTELLLSPTGEWFLRVHRDEHGGRTTLIHRSGRPVHTYPTRGVRSYSAAWTADGREWVEFAGRAEDEPNPPPIAAYVHHVASPAESSQQRRMDLPDTVDAAPYALVPLSGGGVAGTDVSTMASTTAFSVGYAGSGAPRKVHSINTGASDDVHAVLVSPDAKHLAWLFSSTARRSPLTKFIDQWLSWLHSDDPRSSSIWISNLDGSGLHEVASADNRINDLAWCADAKRLWVVYKRTLWTVPAE